MHGARFGARAGTGLRRAGKAFRLRGRIDLLSLPKARNRLDTNLHTGVGSTAEEFAAVYKQAFEVFGGAVKVAGIKPE